MSDNSTPTKNQITTTRRGFFQAWATSWGTALKSATSKEDFPLSYKSLDYTLVEDGGQNTLILNITGTDLEVPAGLSHCMFNPQQIASERSTKKLTDFSKENAVTHLIWDCAVAPKGALPPCPAIILNAPDDFKAVQPCLFLFTEDQALNKGDMLGQIVRKQNVEADLYVGRLDDDLTDSGSPTWTRLKLFIENN